MSLSSKPQTIALVAAIVIVMGVGVFAGFTLLNPTPPEDTDTTITLTLLTNAGVMIEANGLRIYIDPINLPSSYSTLPADAILITHPHGDHYNNTCINMLQKETTVNVFPENMTAEVAAHDGVGVTPLDTFQVGSIDITAYYMYTEVWIDGERFASHPPEANWTSYLINIGGFTIFHAGDSKNITEYSLISGQVDVALLPLGPGCQSMADMEIVDAIDMLQPEYFIPIHFTNNVAAELFVLGFSDEIADCSDCVVMNLEYFSSHTFEP
ncbi:MAG: MBL fold metallo-hydrolase [Candidatus Thorarchaeota archaeon]|jgi:L-ascorbate metabolism protein UlaG (beta-lactamase superfamily)